MPIHLRAEPGDYAPAVLCPGDPRRADYIARTHLTGARQVNGERGLLGFTGTYQGRPLSVQTTGMGGPSAAIVFEELAQLGVQRVVRVGTCGALLPHLHLGDTVVAVSAAPVDRTVATYTGGEAYAPTADWRLVSAAVAEARRVGGQFHVGQVASSDVFYEPDPARPTRLAALGVLALEMEAAVLYTVAALRGLAAVTLLTVSDALYGEAPVRIGDDELQAGVDRMVQIACRVAVDAG
jgi:DeoD family purine-nucleoside phosphorylase